VFTSKPDAPPHGPVHQVVATWNNQVLFAPDPVHGGRLSPGLAGRLYLFGPEIACPLEGDGSLVVDLYDESCDKPVMLEEWRFDHDTLQRLFRKDVIGWGYTVLLPWGTYKPEIKQVHLKVCYQPAMGSPLYAESSSMTLNANDVDTASMIKPAPGATARHVPTAAELAAQAQAQAQTPAHTAASTAPSRVEVSRIPLP
jgi:hypothetical protein